jgi:hypothetical protein
MATDSEAKTEGQPEEKLQARPVEEVMVRSGRIVKLNRGEGGKFTHKSKTMPPSKEFTRLTRNLMLTKVVDKEGNIIKGTKTKYEMMFENLMCIAMGVDTVFPGGVTIYRDAKQDMASAQAYKIATDRGLGALPKSEEELEAMNTQEVRVVLITQPNMDGKVVREELPRPKLQPAFLEAEVVEDKE